MVQVGGSSLQGPFFALHLPKINSPETGFFAGTS